LDGFNCCIFAYGQTGSGKTFTMEGTQDRENETTRGMIARAVEQVFRVSRGLKLLGWKYSMKASFLEIYHDTIFDLLLKGNKDRDLALELKLDPETGACFLPDLTLVDVTTPEKVFELLECASKNRVTGKTNMNDRSSRSHSIFQLQITGHNSKTGEIVKGILNLIDLAGSEKLKQSGAVGDAKKEAISINTSLTFLSNCISALAAGQQPNYRNSKLTRLLQNSLGGNSKTLMFVNLSPASQNVKESSNSLQFAKKVNQCEIGVAKKSSKVQ